MTEHIPDHVPLGASGVRLSPLGLGTNTWGSGRRADPGLRPAFAAALEAGINFFDTAEVYNFGGSERTLGQFLPGTGRKPVVATKFFPMPWRLRKADLLSALRASLARLQVSRVDLYMIHFPAPPVPLETWMQALADAVEAGLTHAVGVSNYNPAQMRRAHAVLAGRGIPLASNQVEYSLLRRGAERSGLLDLCRELGVTLVAYRPVSSGLLTGRYTPTNPPSWIRGRRYDRSYLQRITPLLDRLDALAQAHGKTPSQVALNWVICKGALPIPGARDPRHVAENAGALGWRLEAGEVTELDKASDEIRG